VGGCTGTRYVGPACRDTQGSCARCVAGWRTAREPFGAPERLPGPTIDGPTCQWLCVWRFRIRICGVVRVRGVALRGKPPDASFGITLLLLRKIRFLYWKERGDQARHVVRVP
jgi:hypothetical protein